ncbi:MULTISPECIES: cytochrome c oxidase subunit II [Stutzerimonas stutzeri subgroup]|uniref:Cytochrome c oxidase subunit II n=1 Tax=Stutzerimonas chloritidismutans TaxID=203192 RepID=A0ACC5VNF5_STUCH|nr:MULTISPECIES: cytochrome c oxidase subunit II [Stutzerimonas stutzeri group]MAF87667.1 cytochrome c oxidase subunit II [Pseudomonas sp.]MBU2014448.1 cytochrome c oxidase subunit II [Gammaproteobacteria bacterium]OHC17126.1 MAG: cytochrome c oxidase subunit II [Pseudomonadales bacterium GWC2_63_15]RRU93720.1 cytochrome c oxidase subunit II [Stutzerimonas xanthomarina]KJS77470.1 MAG: cytochrome B559 subunit alpha [[Pseudomonas] sp. BICA1-14]
MSRHPCIWMGLGLSAIFGQAQAAWDVNMRSGATDVSRSVFDLHMTIFWICVVIGVLVFGVMIWSMVAHRRSKRQHSAHFHENTRVEVLWTVIPLLILVGMAIPATRTLIHIYDSSESDVDVQITGYQWKWHYKYLGEDVEFFSNLTTPREQINNQAPKGENYLLEVDEPLVIPAGAKVRFLITAADVIHSWWVPDLAVKKDAIPGFINESWTRVEEPGIYRGQCTELCGKDHGFMPVVVEVKSAEDYAAWLGEKKAEAAKVAELTSKEWTLEELSAHGEKVYQTACASCHQAGGEGIPPMFPALKGSAIATGDIEAHIDIVVNGKPGTAMAAFGKQLSEVDLAAVITYERNAWGNETGEMVTPKDVLDFKQAEEATQ